jgi:hypothetical protein
MMTIILYVVATVYLLGCLSTLYDFAVDDEWPARPAGMSAFNYYGQCAAGVAFCTLAWPLIALLAQVVVLVRDLP